MAEGLPDEIAELAVVLRGIVTDFNDAMEEVRDELEQTKRKAQAAADAINDAMDFGRASAKMDRFEEKLEALGNEALTTKAKLESLSGTDVDIDTDDNLGATTTKVQGTIAALEALDDKDVEVDVDLDRDTFGRVAGSLSAPGGGGGGGDRGLRRSLEQDLSRLQDELFAVINIARKLGPVFQGLLVIVGTAVVAFATLIGAVGGLTVAATALASQLGKSDLRSAITRVEQAFVGLGAEFVDAFAPLIRNQVIPFLTQFANNLRAVIPDLVRLARENLPELLSALDDWPRAIVRFIERMETVVDVFDLIRDGVNLLTQAIRRVAQIFFTYAATGAEDLFGFDSGIDFQEQLQEQNRLLNEDFEAFFEAWRDLRGGGGAGYDGEDRFTGQLLSRRARETLQELQRTFGMIDELRGANIITLPEATSQRLSQLRSALEEILKIRERTDGQAAVDNALQRFGLPSIDSVEELKQRVRELQRDALEDQFQFDRSQLETGVFGPLQTTQKVEQRAVKFVRQFRDLASASAQGREEIRGLLKNMGLTGDQIDRIIERLREVTPIVDKIAQSVNEFASDISDTLASGLISAFRGLFDQGMSQLQRMQRRVRELRIRQRIRRTSDQLFDPETSALQSSIAIQRIGILRKQLQQVRDETNAVAQAFKNMARAAGRAVEQLAQKILRDLIQRAVLQLIRLLPGAGGAGSIAGGIFGFVGSLFGGDGGGGGGGMVGNFPMGGPTTAARAGGAAIQGGQAQIVGNSLVVPVELMDKATQQGQTLNERTGR